MENIYLHAIYAFNNHYSQQDTVRILKHILKSMSFYHEDYKCIEIHMVLMD